MVSSQSMICSMRGASGRTCQHLTGARQLQRSARQSWYVRGRRVARGEAPGATSESVRCSASAGWQDMPAGQGEGKGTDGVGSRQGRAALIVSTIQPSRQRRTAHGQSALQTAAGLKAACASCTPTHCPPAAAVRCLTCGAGLQGLDLRGHQPAQGAPRLRDGWRGEAGMDR